MKKILKTLKTGLTLLVFLHFGIISCQHHRSDKLLKSSEFHWPEGKRMAISLTFDDARLSQPDVCIPLLEKYGVRATFYVSPGNMEKKPDQWKKIAEDGHDIGNHTVLHPCSGNFKWSREKAIEDYTLKRMKDELDSAGRIIERMLGVTPVSFGYPCGQTYIGRGKKTKSYVPLIAGMFETGRGYRNEMPNDPAFCDMAQLAGVELDGKSSDEVKLLIDKASEQGSWLILVGHEVGEGGYQTTLVSTIEEICRYAADPVNGIWIDDVHHIASWINAQRKTE